jgi:hypothetical protein
LTVGTTTGFIAAIKDSGKRLRFAGLALNLAVFAVPPLLLIWIYMIGSRSAFPQ